MTLYIVSCAIAILMGVASASSLIDPERVYRSRDLIRALGRNDALDLLVGLPMLLGAPLAGGTAIRVVELPRRAALGFVAGFGLTCS